MSKSDDFFKFLEKNDLKGVKDKICTKTWEYIIGLENREDWEELGASQTDAKSIINFIKRQQYQGIFAFHCYYSKVVTVVSVLIIHSIVKNYIQ